MTEFQSYLVEPVEPLVFGDGRSIERVGVARTRILPPPSQLAGAVRTRVGSDDAGLWRPDQVDAVLKYTVEGPLGAILDDRGEIADWWLPAPADARVFQSSEDDIEPKVRACVPLERPAGCYGGARGASTVLVGPAVSDPRKLDSDAAPFWSWYHGLRHWLAGAPLAEGFEYRGPERETRTHVALTKNEVAAEGMLFSVTGARYEIHRPTDQRGPWGGHRRQRVRHALVFRTNADLRGGWTGSLGGERRLARWRPLDVSTWPSMPDEVRQSIREAHSLRLILLTPGALGQDGTPELWPNVEVVARIHDRPMVVSGWDYVARAPKPTRRLVPAGAVYFLRLEGDPEEHVRQVELAWLRSVASTERDRRDGHALAVFGVWDGEQPVLGAQRA